jgi:tetratricopeptide (TPR) repeat protein
VKNTFVGSWLLCFALLSGPVAAHGQSALLKLPRDSQRAEVKQRVGITDITVDYHRPLVKGRTVWGNLIPYGQVWRAGANENTIVTFTDDVSVEGKPLAAGTYGLHMIPNKDDWTIIFSKSNSAWGSFTYKEAEDALRVTVKPQPAEFHEALAYDFDDVQPDSTVMTMRWEKIAVPVKIGVNTNEVVEASLRNQMRGLAQYTWDGWDDAANYLLTAKTDYSEALEYSNKSIQVEQRYDNLMTKSKVLAAMGQQQEADATKTKALAMANATQLHSYARGLQVAGKQDEAFKVYQENAHKNPDQWIVHVGLARMYSAQGNYSGAAKEMTAAAAGAPDGTKAPLQALAKKLESNQDINK